MTTSERIKTILSLGLPIIGGMLSQSLLNLIDAVMVGSLGEVALAGIGMGGYATFLAISLIIGLSSGVQAMVARRRGQNRMEDIARPVNWGLVLALLVGLPLTLLFLTFSNNMVALMSADQSALTIADQYFEYRILALVIVGMNFSFRGFWNGTNRPMVYLRVQVLMHGLNVLISYGLIFGHFGLPELGAAGAGLGTTIALYIGCAIVALITWKDARSAGFMKIRHGASSSLGTLLRLSIPHSLQQFFFAASIVVLFWLIGGLGTDQQAIGHVLINLALFLILPGVGLGIAATTLVSHALGENRSDLASRWGWDVIMAATIIMALLSLPMWLAPDIILSLFLHDPALIEEARLPLMLTGLAICLDASAIVLTQALLGAGANRTVMLVTTTGQWCFYLPLAWLVGPYLGFGLLGIWLLQVVHRTLSSLVFIYIWKQRNWVHIRL
ncbi:MAG: MATE family efflux transporter [Amphritea sp.]